MNEQDMVMEYFNQKKDKVCATMLLRKERKARNRIKDNDSVEREE